MSDLNPSEDRNFLGAMGSLALSWGYIEVGLDFSAAIIHHWAGGKQIEAEVPYALQLKLDYLRKAFGILPPLVPFGLMYATLADKITTASERRSALIRSIVVEQMFGAGEAKMMHLLGRPQLHYPKKFDLSTNSILQAAAEANEIGDHSIRLANALTEAFIKS